MSLSRDGSGRWRRAAAVPSALALLDCSGSVVPAGRGVVARAQGCAAPRLTRVAQGRVRARQWTAGAALVCRQGVVRAFGEAAGRLCAGAAAALAIAALQPGSAGFVPRAARRVLRSEDESARAALAVRGETPRQWKHHRFDGTVQLTNLARAELAQPFDHLLDQDFRRRGTRRDTDVPPALDPLGLQLFGAIDHVGWNSAMRGDLAQSVGIRAVGAAHDDDHVALRSRNLTASWRFASP